jgi:Family of unknown function (DUF6677)
MTDPRIPLKQPWLAGLLAFLVPGAGHAYQGRYFKAVIYFVCITGLFLAGMRMSDWKAVYLNKSSPNRETSGRHTLLRFAAQFGVGLPCLWALVQRERFYSENNDSEADLSRPQSFEFTGRVTLNDGSEQPVSGRVDLQPYTDDFGSTQVGGSFAGRDEAGSPLELTLGHDVELDDPIGADRERGLHCRVDSTEGSGSIVSLNGSVPRPVWNWFGAPLDVLQERKLHATLGKFHELAMVFTWVAGLLNLLVIWDAVEGPAYGYGDEPESTRKSDVQQSVANAADPAANSESAELSPEPART